VASLGHPWSVWAAPLCRCAGDGRSRGRIREGDGSGISGSGGAGSIIAQAPRLGSERERDPGAEWRQRVGVDEGEKRNRVGGGGGVRGCMWGAGAAAFYTRVRWVLC
jgi:hypothetical protein